MGVTPRDQMNNRLAQSRELVKLNLEPVLADLESAQVPIGSSFLHY